jgi:hypothetical protein
MLSVMLNVKRLNIKMLSIVMLNVNIINIKMLSVVMLNVNMLSVTEPDTMLIILQLFLLSTDRSTRHVYMVPKKCVEWHSPYDTKATFYKQIVIKAKILGKHS